MNRAIQFLCCYFLLLFPNLVWSADKVVLTGPITSQSCPAACGVCCATHSVTDSSGTLTLLIGNAFVDLSQLSDDGKNHQLSGYFYEGSGQCGVNQCTLFAVEELDTSVGSAANFDSKSQRLSIQSVVIDGNASLPYSVTLSPPYTVDAAVEIDEEKRIPQGGDCSEEAALCASGTVCLSYFGIAGPQGPEFKSCEIPCSHPGATCPFGQSCATIADGPGQVCRAD